MINNSHISNEYDEELKDLREKVLKMGALVEENFCRSNQSTFKR
jgi:phosphate uptake regulator